MNKSLNVFLSVLLCAVLCVGVLTSLSTTDDSASQYSQKEYTSSIPTGIGAPSVSFGVGANGDVLAVPMSSRRSSREQYLQPSKRSTGVADLQGFSRSANSTGMLSLPSLQGGDGGRLFTHMSSSQTMKSFGGGSNSAGVSMSGGVVSTNNLTTSSPNNLITSSPTTPLTSSSNNLISSPTSLLFLSPNNLITSSPLAANYQGLGNTTMGGSRGIRGRQNAAPTNNGYDTWLRWLDSNGPAYAEYDDETGTYTYSEQGAWDAYVDWFNAVYGCNPGEYTGSDPIVTWDMWLGWFTSNNGSHKGNSGWHNFVPVGDYLPLLFMALLYVACIFIRYRELKKI